MVGDLLHTSPLSWASMVGFEEPPPHGISAVHRKTSQQSTPHSLFLGNTIPQQAGLSRTYSKTAEAQVPGGPFSS